MNLFTATQAAAATGLSLKAVQKAIDSNVIPIKIVKSGRGKRRYLSSVSLLCLQLEASGLLAINR